MSGIIYNNVNATEVLDKGIYENLDSIWNREVNTERQQQIGSASVKNRRHRAVQVCLWLLCVLLLTAVIVLCVYFTTDQNHLLTHNYNLTKEREDLSNEIKELNRWLTAQDWSSDYFKWIYYNFSFYYISSELKTWNYSREDCKERGGDLVIIKSKEQQEFIQNATAGYGFDPFWIGLRKEEGLWKWIDEITLTTSFWIDGYPRSNNRYCARTSSSGWSDFSCDDVYGWICEKRIF
ncbi:C-type lectin domain family 4 member M CD209 antigen-like protein 1 [Triplophysa tibetana]|uniref:C-type lectin domain family 4 member M CD209 antigen-like protein 1 n=1 Tax=Triplophysa tibetana TaxID=1572043 RepID=A0A5A9MYT6_9TELE|nr:C-type lectin domain family 4 member M CD209 antigen-like protein 1 [Triplophysa tibetana]